MAKRMIQVQLDVEELLQEMEKMVKAVADKVGGVDSQKLQNNFTALQSAVQTDQNRVNLELTKIHGLIRTNVKDLQRNQEKADEKTSKMEEKMSKMEKEIEEQSKKIAEQDMKILKLELQKCDSDKAQFYKGLLLESLDVLEKSGKETQKLRTKMTTGEIRYNPIGSRGQSVSPIRSRRRSNDSSLYN